MTHDWILGAHFMDVPYYRFFSRLFTEGLAQNTVILFFSDHGIRFGAIRESYYGSQEDRRPFIFVRLPENTQQKYAENLRANQYRLTTPFDIHASLIHLMKGVFDYSIFDQYQINIMVNFQVNLTSWVVTI
jgi:arylsulfatase A-like enzyme